MQEGITADKYKAKIAEFFKEYMNTHIPDGIARVEEVTCLSFSLIRAISGARVIMKIFFEDNIDPADTYKIESIFKNAILVIDRKNNGNDTSGNYTTSITSTEAAIIDKLIFYTAEDNEYTDLMFVVFDLKLTKFFYAENYDSIE